MPIQFEQDLNPAQLEAVHTIEGPVLVIAGAGSGKTRTIVYRLAYLAELGVPPESILLLTFTRKAAQEMLQRAARLHALDSGRGFAAVQGGTFHSLAYSVLRRFPPEGYKSDFTIMDKSDAEAIIKDAKAKLGLGKGDRSYPRASTILETIGKSRNKELELLSVMERDSFHLLPYADDFQSIASAYAQAKVDHGLMDYDDLLTRLETLLTTNPDVLEILRSRYQYIMVDEYQDTNMVQARLVRLLAGEKGNIMAVGDDAQSIYAFRGADIRNILGFPEAYPEAKVIKLERNYRSVQPILDLTNGILAQSSAHFRKELHAVRELEEDKLPALRPELLRPASDLSQARLVVEKVQKLLQRYPAHEVAVLFRAGYQSYHVEVQLNKAGVRFRKYGGVKFSEAAHIKDVLAYLRLVRNPAEILAWQRAVSHIKGIGPKTGAKLFDALLSGDQKYIESWTVKRPELKAMLDELHSLRREELSPFVLLERLMEFYRPILEAEHPDDYPRRWNGLEELLQIASSYTEMDLFLADLSLENPGPKSRDEDDEDSITLSTIHSAKGLEWSAVMIIDLVEERFPSRHALAKADDFEEERRLMYVACTRAKDYLGLFVPASLYRTGMDTMEPTISSPFLTDIPGDCYDEIRENHRPRSLVHLDPLPPSFAAPASSASLGFCQHKIFGRGKIVAHLPPDKYRVNFSGFGLKVILAQYLELE
jgi:DNA helicase II / ATP-dependent DNA helicase PcrA